jgi:hypothetical protein
MPLCRLVFEFERLANADDGNARFSLSCGHPISGESALSSAELDEDQVIQALISLGIPLNAKWQILDREPGDPPIAYELKVREETAVEFGWTRG